MKIVKVATYKYVPTGMFESKKLFMGYELQLVPEEGKEICPEDVHECGSCESCQAMYKAEREAERGSACFMEFRERW